MAPSMRRFASARCAASGAMTSTCACAEITASGVRSSWAASCTKPCSRASQRRATLFSNALYGNALAKPFQLFYDFHPLLIDRAYTLKVAADSWRDDTLVELEYMEDAPTDDAPAMAVAP